MTRYRKKPVEIEAVQFSARITDCQVFPDWLTEARANGTVEYRLEKNGPGYLLIKTLEGEMRANQDDWIIRGINGELYPCKPDIFAATYEQVAS
jgi:hypothetical protein